MLVAASTTSLTAKVMPLLLDVEYLIYTLYKGEGGIIQHPLFNTSPNKAVSPHMEI